jgi:hypothetical protein
MASGEHRKGRVQAAITTVCYSLRNSGIASVHGAPPAALRAAIRLHGVVGDKTDIGQRIMSVQLEAVAWGARVRRISAGLQRDMFAWQG